MKSVEQQALDFVKEIAVYPDDKYAPFTLNDLIDKAQIIVDQTCKHENNKRVKRWNKYRFRIKNIR